MIENDVAFSPILRANVPVDKGFRFGPFVELNGDDGAIKNWMKSVSIADDLTEANLRIVREGEEIFFEATTKIDAFEKFCLWSNFDDGHMLMESQTLPIPNLPGTDSSLLPNTTKRKKRVFECKICHVLLKDSSKLISHNASHTNETPYKCSLCEQTYRWKSCLEHHVSIMHLQKYKCQICHRAFVNQKKLSEHEQIHSGKMPFNCEECGAGYRSSTGLKNHVEKIHSLFKCGVCGKVWNSKELLKQHKRNHDIDRQASLQKMFAKQKEKGTVECQICHYEICNSEQAIILHTESHTNDKPFECSFCGRTFRRRGDLDHHASRLHNRGYKCHLCEEAYPKKKELKAHLLMTHGEKPFQCDECRAKYKTRIGLRNHRQKIHNTIENDVAFLPDLRTNGSVHRGSLDKGFRFGPFVENDGAIKDLMKSVSIAEDLSAANMMTVREGECIFFEATKNIDVFEKLRLWPKFDDGQLVADIGSSLTSSTTKTKGLVFECDICHRLYKRGRNLMSHRSSHTNEKPFNCSLCERSYRWKDTLQAHVDVVHLQKYRCHICKKVFSSGRCLSNHQVTHSENVSFNCEECDARYKSSSGLTKHLRTRHSVFKCLPCGKAWKSYQLWKEHRKSHDIEWQSSLFEISEQQKEERMYECDICHLRMINARSLLIHKASHSYDKPFECSLCGITYQRLADLARHTAKEHELENYKCHLCEAFYKSKTKLTNHLKTHFGEKIFHCDECGATYKTMTGLKNHQQRVHSQFKCFCGDLSESKELLEQHTKCHYASTESWSGG